MDIEDDILQAAKELARRDGSTAGRVLSALARLGLKGGREGNNPPQGLRNGVPVLPSRGEVITVDHVRELMDEEGN